MATMHRARAVMNVDTRSPNEVTGKAKGMNQGIGGNVPLFPTPSPPLSAIMAQTVVVEKASVLATTRAKGTAKARNVQLRILVGLLEAEVLYVQSIADASATPDQAAATIEAAGLTVALVGQYAKPVLAAKQGAVPGGVILEANKRILTGGSQKKSFFNWSYTADGGKTWLALPSTPKVTTSLANLVPLSTYGFRVSLTSSDGIPGEWSQPVFFIVH
jgi:hypothetical protein